MKREYNNILKGIPLQVFQESSFLAGCNGIPAYFRQLASNKELILFIANSLRQYLLKNKYITINRIF